MTAARAAIPCGAPARAQPEPWHPPALLGSTAYRRIGRALDRSGLKRWLEFHVHVYIAAERERLRAPARPPRGLRLAQETAAALPALAALRPEPIEALRERFEAGHWCFAAWQGQRCVAYLWAVAGPADLPSLLGCIWRIPASWVWIYDLYTVPGLIGAFGHLNQALWRAMGGEWRSIAGQVECDNRASRAAHASLGFAELGAIWSWRLGPWRWHCIQDHRRHRRRWRWGTPAIAPDEWT
ncbi:MAG TPA: hypothetical protein VE996_12545 [Terriglobales bacterium]|nr:hypothetical protein [Terriglobales bacterium]